MIRHAHSARPQSVMGRRLASAPTGCRPSKSPWWLSVGVFSVALVLVAGAATRADTVEDVTLAVDWPDFLERHALVWNWTFTSGGGYLQLMSDPSLQQCGPHGQQGSCCLQGDEQTGRVVLAGCNASGAGQQWRQGPQGELQLGPDGPCLTASQSNAVLQNCTLGASLPGQQWGVFGNYFVSQANQADCLRVSTAAPFCDTSICPRAWLQPFSVGDSLTVMTCQNGDQASFWGLFDAHTGKQNLEPLFWASQACALGAPRGDWACCVYPRPPACFLPCSHGMSPLV